MTSASSNRRNARCAFALVAGIVVASSACTLDLQGKASGGAGGSSGASTSASGSTSTSSAGSTSTGGGTGGAAPACVAGTMMPCYEGTMGTENKGPCKAGVKTCMSDTMMYGACVGQVVPSGENCFTPGDEDCNGMETVCNGTTVAGDKITSAGDEVAFGVATDTAGNVVVGGVAKSSVGGGVTVSDGLGFVVKVNPSTGAPAWSQTLASSNAGDYSVVRGVATDKLDNVFIVGEFTGSIMENNVKLTSAGGTDIFFIKLDPMGKVLCQNAFGDGSDQLGTAVAVDGDGNAFITGTMGGTVSFGGATIKANGNQDVFVAKLDKDCVHVWSKAFGDGGTNQVGHGLAATPQGDVVVVGGVQGNIDFGNGNLTSGAGDDVFVAKLSAANGTGLWSKRFGDGKDQNAYGVAVGSDGNVVITGTMFGKCDFGGGPLDAGASADAFVASLHADGSPSWSKNYGSAAEVQAGLGVAIDADKNLVVVGYFKDTIQFAATTLTEAAGSNKPDADLFVAKLSPDGKSGWARSFGDINDQKAWAVTTNAARDVIVGGTFEGGLVFGGPLGTFNSGGYDGFWVRFAP